MSIFVELRAKLSKVDTVLFMEILLVKVLHVKDIFIFIKKIFELKLFLLKKNFPKMIPSKLYMICVKTGTIIPIERANDHNHYNVQHTCCPIHLSRNCCQYLPGAIVKGDKERIITHIKKRIK